MASPVKVSKYRSGVPRFGRVDIDWNPADTLKTYKLTPDELEQYKAGKSVDEILRDREGGKMAFEMPIEEFIDLYYNQNLIMKEIAAKKGISPATLYNWKQRHKDEVEKALKEAELKCRKVSESKTTQTELKDENEPKKEKITALENELREKHENEIKSLREQNEKYKAMIEDKNVELAEKDEEINKLAKEVIDAHKLVTEWQEKYEKLDERFGVALQVKDHAITENAELENIRLKLERKNKELAERLEELNKEIVVLRELSYLKLAKEVETA